ncbi:Flagellar biosynthetic protein FliR [Eubacterium plexicaudatum ASF492]|nr:Flagellar biosynthetic protein FliR [Eubacterium plexicaudatum ASF492]
MFNATYSLQTFEYFLLVLVRIAACIFAAPFFNTKGVPTKTKIGVAGCIAIMLTGVLPEQNLAYTGIMEYGVIVIKEGITGLLIGYSASICNSIVLFAGSLIDMQIGLSMAQEFNPMTMMNESITGNLYNYMVMLMLLASNMYHYVIRAVCESYQLLPINRQVFQWDHLLEGIASYMSALVMIGFRITLPVFACMMLVNCVLGILAKVSPQMNMFSVGIQIKVLVGLSILFLAFMLLDSVADNIAQEMKRLVVYMIKGMYVSE